MIPSIEEAELLESFKRQLNDKIQIFHERHAAVLKKEHELRVLNQKIEDAKLEFDKELAENQKTLETLREQIKFEREMLRIEQQARNSYFLRSNCIIKVAPALQVIKSKKI